MFKLSVIIPIYKVEKYLNQCIDSIIDKHLLNIEIILVDDGSTDDSSNIADLYANNYYFIKTIHKENGGLSSARNVGIKLATGEYIMFVDSDDWWNPEVDMNEVLSIVNNNKGIEMFLLSSLDYIEGEGLFKRKEHYNLSKIRTDSVDNYYSDLLNNGNLEVHAATKILKSEFINKNNLFFKEGITSEDNEWMLRLLRKLNKVLIIDKPLYIYRANREGSITNNIKYKNIKDLLDIIKFVVENKDSHVYKYETSYCSYLWFCCLGLSSFLQKHEVETLEDIFKGTSYVCEYSNSTKTKISYFVYIIFGLGITRLILGIYLRLKKQININKIKVGV